jgi:hypothetical protein
MENTQPRGWWSRNWKWVVPVGCIVPTVVCAGICGGIVALGLGMLKSSWAFSEGVELARHDPKVIEELGEPIETGWQISGNVNVNGPSGEAELSIPLSGPKKQGTLFVVAKKRTGEWKFEKAEVQVEGRPDKINLLQSVPPIDAPAVKKPAALK